MHLPQQTRSGADHFSQNRTSKAYSLLEMIRGPTLSPVSLLCFTWVPSHIGNCTTKPLSYTV